MTSNVRPPKPQKRNGFWYLVRRVLQHYRHIEKRGRVSTGICIREDSHF
jgi:hypothetical protein